MSALPERAGGTDDVYSTNPVQQNPAFVSLQHESQATAYADGATTGPGYSPVSGRYQYTFRAGSWLSATQPHSPSSVLPGMVLNLNLENDMQKGLVLPAQTSLHVQRLDKDGKPMPDYQGEQKASGDGSKTIAPNDLILFGSTLQTWEATQPGTARVSLTIEQSTQDARSVDLCWEILTGGNSRIVYCTTTTIPAGWAPGQPLKPQSYYGAKGGSSTDSYWNTNVTQ